MKITKETNNGTTIFRIEGEVTGAISGELRKVFASVLAGGEKQIIIDASRLEYIDSSGLAALIDFHVKLKRTGGKVSMCSLNQNIESVFKLAKLNALIPVYPGLNEALN